jgi:flavin-binding protein dodecin
MDNHVYKKIQITGTSNSSADEAVRTAVDRAGKTIHNLRWFRVTDTRDRIDNQQIAHWQVTIELGFVLD